MVTTEHRNRGAATLIIAVILLVVSTLFMIFSSKFNRSMEQTSSNLVRNSQAFQAAEAGMEFGINYLQTNANTILANPVSGFIPTYSDANTTNIALANSSHFSVIYNNPIANNYNLVKITSTGTSDDSSSTKVITQLVQMGSLYQTIGESALTSKGAITVKGNSTIRNTVTDVTIQSGSSVTFSGSGNTDTSSGGSDKNHIGSDVQANSTTLSNMSQNDFFASYFGTTNTDSIKSQVANSYTNSSNTNYSSTLNGMSGTSIWITQTGSSTATINGNTTIGSPTNPVLLIINGNISMSGNVTIYGFIYIFGTSGIETFTGNITINGGIATTDNITMDGSSDLIYDTSVLNNLQNQTSMRYYAKVPGSWKDF